MQARPSLLARNRLQELAFCFSCGTILCRVLFAMKVLLVQPPIEDFYDTSIRTYPLGLLCIAAKTADIADVSVLDARSGGQRTLGRHPFPELNPFYMDGIATPFSFFNRYSSYGMTDGEIRDAIARHNPDLVAISSLCSAYEGQALHVAKIAKTVNPAMVTVLGGIHPTLFPAEVLRNADVDYCIRGEGETPFLELVSALSNDQKGRFEGITGLCFRRNGSLHLGQINIENDIDIIPARRCVDADRYKIGRKRYSFLLTSRGCPFNCGFCGKPPVPYRKRTLSSLEGEVAECESLGIEAIDFEDDMLNLDGRFFAEVLGLFSGRGFTLSAMNGIYPGNIDVPLLKAMHKAGFRRLNFSLVDTAETVLSGQKRRQHQGFVDLLPFLGDSPFLVEVHFIIGLPGQEPGALLDTLLFLMEKRLLLGPSIFYLAPGSALCPSDRLHGQVPFEQMRSSFMYSINPLFPRTVIFTFIKLVRFINWVKQVIDRNQGIERISELLDGPAVPGDETSSMIVKHLLREKRLVRWEKKTGGLTEEPVDQSLVASFFDKSKGRCIKGFKSGRSVAMDV